MLRNVNQLTGFTIAAADGDLGSVDTVYFDDDKWTIRYFVIDTGRWLSGRKVLISPMSVRSIDWSELTMHLNLSKSQIESSPGIDTDKPVSRQHEAQYHDHFGYPYYWTGPFVWGVTAFPDATLVAESNQEGEVRGDQARRHNAQADADPHLRSCKEVIGYAIQASDDTVGHAEDFLFDDASWTIHLIVVDPRNWWPGKHVMIAPERVERIDWQAQKVVVDLTRKEVESSPDYDSTNLSPQAGSDRSGGIGHRGA